MPTNAQLQRGLFAVATAALLTGCQQVGQPDAPFGQPLQGGTFENRGGVIEEPGVFSIANGQNFTTPFSVDCTKLNASVSGWQDAVTAGAHHVLITVPGQRVYGGVLALCRVDASATGPSSRSYSIVIPDDRFPQAADGLIASVAEKVSVNRAAPINVAALLVQTGQPAFGRITEDYAWMLWFSDRPAALGVTFAAPEPPPPSASRSSGISLVKNASYSVATSTNLYAGASRGSAVLEALKSGETVTANGGRKGSYWSVTAADGQVGWVPSRSLAAQ